MAGQGTTVQAHQYQLVDKAIARYAADPVYYRLRQVNVDGTATYSPVRTVRVSQPASFVVQLYPNPSGSTVAPTLLLRTPEAGPVRWELTDALGRTVLNESVTVPTGTSTWPLESAASLPTGVYLVFIQQGKQHHTIKMLRE